jgi:mRNA interferase RelE/StbE
MNYQIKFRASALKEILSLPEKLSSRVQSAIEGLSENPRPFGYIKLHGFENLFRIRVGDIRVIYAIEEEIKIIEIRTIGNRREIYRKR